MKLFKITVNGIEYSVWAINEREARKIAGKMGVNSARASAERNGKRLGNSQNAQS